MTSVMAQSEKDTIFKLPKGEEPLNLMTGVFLKSVYFLDPELTKCIVTGIFKNRGNTLGVLIKGRKGCVFWTYDAFSQLHVLFNKITLAIAEQKQLQIKLDTGEDVKINNVFGLTYTCVSDGKHSVALNSSEWHVLINNLPLVYNSMRDLFYFEDLIKEFICQTLVNTDYYCELLPSLVSERLYNEVALLKRWPNGSSV